MLLQFIGFSLSSSSTLFLSLQKGKGMYVTQPFCPDIRNNAPNLHQDLYHSSRDNHQDLHDRMIQTIQSKDFIEEEINF